MQLRHAQIQGSLPDASEPQSRWECVPLILLLGAGSHAAVQSIGALEPELHSRGVAPVVFSLIALAPHAFSLLMPTVWGDAFTRCEPAAILLAPGLLVGGQATILLGLLQRGPLSLALLCLGFAAFSASRAGIAVVQYAVLARCLHFSKLVFGLCATTVTTHAIGAAVQLLVPQLLKRGGLQAVEFALLLPALAGLISGVALCVRLPPPPPPPPPPTPEEPSSLGSCSALPLHPAPEGATRPPPALHAHRRFHGPVHRLRRPHPARLRLRRPVPRLRAGSACEVEGEESHPAARRLAPSSPPPAASRPSPAPPPPARFAPPPPSVSSGAAPSTRPTCPTCPLPPTLRPSQAILHARPAPLLRLAHERAAAVARAHAARRWRARRLQQDGSPPRPPAPRPRLRRRHRARRRRVTRDADALRHHAADGDLRRGAAAAARGRRLVGGAAAREGDHSRLVGLARRYSQPRRRRHRRAAAATRAGEADTHSPYRSQAPPRCPPSSARPRPLPQVPLIVGARAVPRVYGVLESCYIAGLTVSGLLMGAARQWAGGYRGALWLLALVLLVSVAVCAALRRIVRLQQAAAEREGARRHPLRQGGRDLELPERTSERTASLDDTRRALHVALLPPSPTRELWQSAGRRASSLDSPSRRAASMEARALIGRSQSMLAA